MGAAVAIAVMRRKEEEIRTEFFRAGATTALNARSLADMGLEENRALKRLVRRSCVREASPGLFYLDEEVFQSVRSMRRRTALIMLVTILLLSALVMYGVVTFN
ncbi:MAG: hypothetical protein ABIQ55_08045 [Gemmatimonadaceae bacterium]